MTKLAMLPLLLILLAWPMYAQSLPPSTIPANDCAGLASACSRAADELKAARELLKALESEKAVIAARLDLEKERTALERERGELFKQQAENLQAAIVALKDASTAKDQLIATEAKRVEVLEKRLSRSRTLNLLSLIGGLAAAAVLSR